MSAGDGPIAPMPVLYETVLKPHRSLPPRGFFYVMAAVSAVSLASSIGFWLRGAWPVAGFFGLDGGLLYLFFRLNYRSARQSETLRLVGDVFSVEKVSVRGERRFWRFQPFWLRVRLIETDEDRNRLLLTSHGRSLSIAGFLTAQHRRNLALDIEGALKSYKTLRDPAAEG
jgi:uncharacterized membrane protein